MYVFEAVEDFILECEIKNLAHKTVKNRKFELGQFNVYCNKNDITSVNDITERDVKNYFRQHQKRGLSTSSMRSYYFALNTFFNFLIEEGEIKSNPLENMKPPAVKKSTIVAFNSVEVNKMINSYTFKSFKQARAKCIITLLADTGIRSVEIIGISLSDIDDSQILIKKAKGGRERYVYMSALCRRTLIKYLKIRRKYFSDHILIDDDALFVTSTTGKRMQYPGLLQIVKRAGERAEITDKRVSPHSFRHFYAIQSLLAGIDIYSLQRLLGHSDLATTQIYLHSMKDVEVKRQAMKYSPIMNLHKK
ncbi:tyrosine-type recombinase/integrase [Brochothrix thermosphacta]|uniref:tyrosine-type recombinase/integrase n=1 Tax=Brochothrix thermosphacta TaxID=2756 RepID=UPI00083F7144|nr:tyrosine-type recombinase/integrase [Brochothrix thermosphacta]ODJ62307.1 hypothetical protein BFR35_02780 [Brochothrix thermosphacta]